MIRGSVIRQQCHELATVPYCVQYVNLNGLASSEPPVSQCAVARCTATAEWASDVTHDTGLVVRKYQMSRKL